MSQAPIEDGETEAQSSWITGSFAILWALELYGLRISEASSKACTSPDEMAAGSPLTYEPPTTFYTLATTTCSTLLSQGADRLLVRADQFFASGQHGRCPPRALPAYAVASLKDMGYAGLPGRHKCQFLLHDPHRWPRTRQLIDSAWVFPSALQLPEQVPRDI